MYLLFIRESFTYICLLFPTNTEVKDANIYLYSFCLQIEYVKMTAWIKLWIYVTAPEVLVNKLKIITQQFNQNYLCTCFLTSSYLFAWGNHVFWLTPGIKKVCLIQILAIWIWRNILLFAVNKISLFVGGNTSNLFKFWKIWWKR